jgi:hypothetical protein
MILIVLQAAKYSVRDDKCISPHLFCDFCLLLTMSEGSVVIIMVDFHKQFKPLSLAIKFHFSLV